MSQDLTEEQKELLSKVCVVVLKMVSVNCLIDEEKLNFEDETRKLFQNNPYKFGNAILDIHDVFDLSVEYNSLEEFELFPTLAITIQYFFGYLLDNKEKESVSTHSGEESAQELTDVEKNLLGEVCVVVSTSMSVHCNIDKEKINFEDNVRDLFNDNIYNFGHMLMDVNEMYHLEFGYEPLKEFDRFKTVEDVVRYFFNLLLIRKDKGLDVNNTLYTLLPYYKEQKKVTYVTSKLTNKERTIVDLWLEGKTSTEIRNDYSVDPDNTTRKNQISSVLNKLNLKSGEKVVELIQIIDCFSIDPQNLNPTFTHAPFTELDLIINNFMTDPNNVKVVEKLPVVKRDGWQPY